MEKFYLYTVNIVYIYEHVGVHQHVKYMCHVGREPAYISYVHLIPISHMWSNFYMSYHLGHRAGYMALPPEYMWQCPSTSRPA